MSLRDEQMAFLKDLPKLLSWLWSNGFEVTGGELMRPQEMQDIYVKTGRSKTNRSNHLVKCAIDLNIFINGSLCTLEQIRPAGAYWESLDSKNRWGGNFSTIKDSPHFERNVV